MPTLKEVYFWGYSYLGGYHAQLVVPLVGLFEPGPPSRRAQQGLPCSVMSCPQVSHDSSLHPDIMTYGAS